MGVTISNYGYMLNCPEERLKELVARQPIVTYVGADKSFHGYTDVSLFIIFMVLHLLSVTYFLLDEHMNEHKCFFYCRRF